MGASHHINKLTPKAHCMDILYSALHRCFKLNDRGFRFSLSKLPTLIFTRLQFKSFEIKTRLVFCVPGEIAIIESAILILIISCIKKGVNTSYASGLTQPQVSTLVSSFYGYVTGSFDASGFDLRVHGFYICLFFCVLECTIFKNHMLLRDVCKFLC